MCCCHMCASTSYYTQDLLAAAAAVLRAWQFTSWGRHAGGLSSIADGTGQLWTAIGDEGGALTFSAKPPAPGGNASWGREYPAVALAPALAPAAALLGTGVAVVC